jgi:hypothetical protein
MEACCNGDLAFATCWTVSEGKDFNFWLYKLANFHLINLLLHLCVVSIFL